MNSGSVDSDAESAAGVDVGVARVFSHHPLGGLLPLSGMSDPGELS